MPLRTRVIAATALWLVIALHAPVPAAVVDKVKFNLSWLPQGSTGGVLVAIGKGFYAEAGLDVSAVRGYGGQRTVNEVDQGLFEFGYGDPVSVMLNRAQGGATVMVAALNTQWPAALCYVDRAGRALTSLADLKGLTLGGGAASPVHNIVPAWLALNGLPATHLKLLRLDPAVINTALLDGRIDLAECWEGANRPVLEKLGRESGKTIRWLRYRDFSLNLYGNGIVTTEKIVAANPDLVRRFVKATLRGYEFQQQRPQEAADLIVARATLLERQTLLQQILEANALVKDADLTVPRGRIRDDRMLATAEFVKRAFAATQSVRPADTYTNRFVE